MKNSLVFNVKHLLVFCITFSVTINASSQEKNKELSSPERTIPESVVLEKSESVTFPIKSKTTTDVNYEKNIKKSKLTQANLDRKPVVLVKNDKYYTDKITELKRRIQEIQDNPNSPNVNIEKLNGLTEQLLIVEQKHIEFKK